MQFAPASLIVTVRLAGGFAYRTVPEWLATKRAYWTILAGLRGWIVAPSESAASTIALAISP